LARDLIFCLKAIDCSHWRNSEKLWIGCALPKPLANEGSEELESHCIEGQRHHADDQHQGAA
jgi:hypothetical protein